MATVLDHEQRIALGTQWERYKGKWQNVAKPFEGKGDIDEAELLRQFLLLKPDVDKVWNEAFQAGYTGNQIYDSLLIALPKVFQQYIYVILEGLVSEFLLNPHRYERPAARVNTVGGPEQNILYIQDLVTSRIKATLSHLATQAGELFVGDDRRVLSESVATAFEESGNLQSSLRAALDTAERKRSLEPAWVYSKFLVELVDQVLRDTGVEQIKTLRYTMAKKLLSSGFTWDDTYHEGIRYKRTPEVKDRRGDRVEKVIFRILGTVLRIEVRSPQRDDLVRAFNQDLADNIDYEMPFELASVIDQGQQFYEVVPKSPRQFDFLLDLERLLQQERQPAENWAVLTWHHQDLRGFTFSLKGGRIEILVDASNERKIILVADADAKIQDIKNQTVDILASFGLKLMDASGRKVDESIAGIENLYFVDDQEL